MANGGARGGIVAGVIALLALAPAAGAHGTGAESIADHAQEDQVAMRLQRQDQRRWDNMSEAERESASAAAMSQAQELAKATAGNPRKVGKWSDAPFSLPNYAIHAAMLPTGKVLFWGYPFFDDLQNRGEASVWDPAKGYGPDAFDDVDPPQVDPDGPDGPQGFVAAPIYCSGQSFLADGSLLIAGGNLAWPYQDSRFSGAPGADFVFTFDPWTESWTQQPSMSHGRWYPSQVELADGTTLIAGGYSDVEPGGIDNTDVEVFAPPAVRGGVGTIGKYGSASRETELYPHLFSLPNSDVLLAGPGDKDSAILPLSTLGQGPLEWQSLAKTSGFRVGGSAVLRPGSPRGSWKVTQVGGYGTIPSVDGYSEATRTSETIDARHPDKGWAKSEALNLGRSYQNTVLLPDQSMVAVGGGTGYTKANGNWTIDPSGKRRRVEILGAGSKHWKLGPAQLEDRSYHSTAVLLPDGRVWSAGDDRFPLEPDGTKARGDSAEIYSPPYLFHGARPKFESATETAVYNQTFYATMKESAPDARKFVLVAPGATTHGADMQQRVVPLKVTNREAGTSELLAPANSGVAPPGHYMLFGLSAKGVPAVARWITLRY